MDDISRKYDQNFFLNLVRPADGSLQARRDARRRWRAWRSDPAHKDVAATFAGVDFRTPENAGVSFSGLELGDGADFSKAQFGRKTRFVRARFGKNARFHGAAFGNRAQFGGAAFGVGAWFDGAAFGVGAQFDGAAFGVGARFDGAAFGDWARFDGAAFGRWADFDGAAFGDWANFDGAAFGDWASFRTTLFKGSANFSGQPLDRWARRAREQLCGASARGSDEDKAARGKAFDQRLEDDEFNPHRFLDIDFSDARILGEISFARRAFEGPANFTGTQLHMPPDFDGATNLQRLDLTGAHVGFTPPDQPLFKPHWTDNSKIPIRLRAFRAVAETTKNHDLERDLYIEERKAERGVYWRRYADAIDFQQTLKAARAMLGWRTAPLWFDPFSPPESAAARAERLSRGRSRLTRPAMIGWSAPARVRLRRGFAKRAASLARALIRWSVHALWIAVMAGYWAFSDYGRSLLRPVAWFVISIFLFMGLFIVELHDKRANAGAEAQAMTAAPAFGFSPPPQANDPDTMREARRKAKAEHLAAARQLAISNAIPFVGPLTIDSDVKKFLLCGVPPDDPKLKSCTPIAPRAYQATLIAQNIFSALLLFFFGLALRNYFKVK